MKTIIANIPDENGEIHEVECVTVESLREIFPDWPGEYPTEDGWYYFFYDSNPDDIQIVWFDQEENRYFVRYDESGRNVTEGRKEQFGPRCPMWRKYE